MKRIKILRNLAPPWPKHCYEQEVEESDAVADALVAAQLAIVLQAIPDEPIQAVPDPPALKAIAPDPVSSQAQAKQKRQSKPKSQSKE